MPSASPNDYLLYNTVTAVDDVRRYLKLELKMVKAIKSVQTMFEIHAKDRARTIVRARKERDAVKKYRKLVTPLLNMLAPAPSSEDHYVSVDTTWEGKPRINVTFYQLESFKCNKLMATLWALENWAEVKTTKTQDYPPAFNRDFRYTFVNDVEVVVNAYVSHDSATCKRVVIGTEIVEKYAMKCD